MRTDTRLDLLAPLTLLGSLLGLVAPALVDPSTAGPDSSGTGSFAADWLATSDAAKEAQPQWMTPLVTVTPRLEQEIRYDQSWQERPKDVARDNYGNTKGLELIPSLNSELILFPWLRAPFCVRTRR